MNRTLAIVLALVCIALLVFSFLGVTNSVHESAKIVYAIGIAVTSASLSRLVRLGN